MMRVQWRPEDEALSAFIEEYLDTFCTWDVLVYLAHHPDFFGPADRLAALVGRPIAEAVASMRRLVEKGLAEVVAGEGGDRYRLAAGDERLELLHRFAVGQEDRTVRMEALRKVMSRLTEPRKGGLGSGAGPRGAGPGDGGFGDAGPGDAG